MRIFYSFLGIYPLHLKQLLWLRMYRIEHNYYMLSWSFYCIIDKRLSVILKYKNDIFRYYFWWVRFFFFEFSIFLLSLVQTVRINLWRPRTYSEYAFAVLPIVPPPLWKFMFMEKEKKISGACRVALITPYPWHYWLRASVRYFWCMVWDNNL